jgi:hypothetical protein
MCGAGRRRRHEPADDRDHNRGLSHAVAFSSEKAASIAKATEACAVPGNIEKGIDVARDIEEIVYEVNTFLNVASMINRLGKV